MVLMPISVDSFLVKPVSLSFLEAGFSFTSRIHQDVQMGIITGENVKQLCLISVRMARISQFR